MFWVQRNAMRATPAPRRTISRVPPMRSASVGMVRRAYASQYRVLMRRRRRAARCSAGVSRSSLMVTPRPFSCACHVYSHQGNKSLFGEASFRASSHITASVRRRIRQRSWSSSARADARGGHREKQHGHSQSVGAEPHEDAPQNAATCGALRLHCLGQWTTEL